MIDPKEPARRYLLGEASVEEAEAIELAVLRYEEAAAELAAAEDDLIEEVLDGRASRVTRERFETHYLASPSHRRRVAIVRDLRRRAGRARGSRRVLPYLALAAVVVVGVLAVVDRESTVVLSIPAVAERSEGVAPTLRLESPKQPAELHLERLHEANGADAAVVRHVDGEVAFRGTARIDGAYWIVSIPGGKLPPGDFLLEIGDVTPQRAYFRVVVP